MAPPLLVTTPGSPTANSYITEQNLRDYADARPHSTDLSGYTDEQLRPFCLQATVVIDAMEPRGEPTYIDGALRWPRQPVYKPDGFRYYDFNTYPQPLLDGCCEIALGYVSEDIYAPGDMDGFKSVKIGSLTFSADKATESSPINDTARLYLDHLMHAFTPTKAGSFGVSRVARI